MAASRADTRFDSAKRVCRFHPNAPSARDEAVSRQAPNRAIIKHGRRACHRDSSVMTARNSMPARSASATARRGRESVRPPNSQVKNMTLKVLAPGRLGTVKVNILGLAVGGSRNLPGTSSPPLTMLKMAISAFEEMTTRGRVNVSSSRPVVS
jgi:hypothetical protein